MLISYSSARYVAVIIATVECFCYGMTLGGWPSLVYLLKQDGIFRHLCVTNSSDSESNLPGKSSSEGPRNQKVCFEEEAMYNLAVSVGKSFKYLGFLPVAFLIDKFGVKLARLLGCLFAVSGGLTLGLCTKDRPYLLILGTSLVGVSGPLYILSNLQLANVFQANKSTVLSILGVAQAASAMLYLLFKFLSDNASISWNTSLMVWGSSAFLTLLPTFLLWPKIMKGSTPSGNYEEFTNDGSDHPKEKMDEEPIRNSYEHCKKANYNSVEKQESRNEEEQSFVKVLLSFPFIVHCYAITVHTINIGLYNDSYNWWINEVTNDQNTVSALTNLLGLVVIIKMLLAPLGGVIMDYLCRKRKRENADVRKAGFYPLLAASIFHTSLAIVMMKDSLLCVRISTFLFPSAQAAYIVSAFSYTRSRFPKDHYNRLIGVTQLISGVEPVLQYLLFRLLMSKEIVARLIVLLFVGISFLDPLHLLCLPKEGI